MTRSTVADRVDVPGVLAALVQDLRRVLTREGGFTLDHRSGEHFRSGVAVSVAPATALTFPFSEWVDERVADWLAQHRPRLAAGDVYLGGWHDTRSDQVWLDLVHVYPPDGRDTAAAVGASNQQQAIFDLCQGREIWLDCPGPVA